MPSSTASLPKRASTPAASNSAAAACSSRPNGAPPPVTMASSGTIIARVRPSKNPPIAISSAARTPRRPAKHATSRRNSRTYGSTAASLRAWASLLSFDSGITIDRLAFIVLLSRADHRKPQAAP
jgi:hypothetical protein